MAARHGNKNFLSQLAVVHPCGRDDGAGRRSWLWPEQHLSGVAALVEVPVGVGGFLKREHPVEYSLTRSAGRYSP